MFFPACERQISMVLDYLAADLWTTYKEIEDLELQDRRRGGVDYQKHRSHGKFGEEKMKLMEKMMVDIERYRMSCHFWPYPLLVNK